MKNNKGLKDLFKQLMPSVDMTEVQAEFLLENYLDEETILGIHNTISSDYGSFFEKGLYNQNSMGKNSEDLSNTVMYTDLFPGLMAYPNGDGENRGKTAIILKIPKKVFTHEQGIFEYLPSGYCIIPTQFIIGAFQDGKVFKNEKYDREYESQNAVKCKDSVKFQDKKLNAKIFRKLYKPKTKLLNHSFINLIRRIKNRHKTLLLGNGENENKTINNKKEFYEDLAKGSPTQEEQKMNSINFINKREEIGDNSSYKNGPNKEEK